jgi:FkbM family methyltransferase
MIKTATNIIKGVLRSKKHTDSNFKKIPWIREKIIKHKEDRTIKKILFPHFSILYKRPYELLHSYKEIFEKEIYRFVSNSNSPLIIDCGSNIGLSILYFKQLYPLAKIIAFEPDQNNFELLKLNTQKNNLTNIELNQSAVWITNGHISFEAKESEASHISENDSHHKVESIRLNDLLNNYKEIDFLKIDIEGAEFHVIKDIESNLQKVGNLFLEYHGKVDETYKLNEILNLLNRCGFNVYIKNAADNLDKPFIQKRTGNIYDVQLNLFCYSNQ